MTRPDVLTQAAEVLVLARRDLIAAGFEPDYVVDVLAAIEAEQAREEDWSGLAVDLRKELNLPPDADRHEITVAVWNAKRAAEQSCVSPDREALAEMEELARTLDGDHMHVGDLRIASRKAAALLRRLASATGAGEWREIATAPENGPLWLDYGDGALSIGKFEPANPPISEEGYWRMLGRVSDRGLSLISGGRGNPIPRRWQPLPAPPSPIRRASHERQSRRVRAASSPRNIGGPWTVRV